MAPVLRIVRLLGTAHIVLDDRHLRHGFDDNLRPVGLSPVVFDDVVPAVHHVAHQRDFVVHGVRRANAHVVVRNRKREQERTRVVPVVLGFDDLGTVLRDELAHVDLKPFAHWRQVARIPLLDVFQDPDP